jgi:hypothetical protein
MCVLSVGIQLEICKNFLRNAFWLIKIIYGEVTYYIFNIKVQYLKVQGGQGASYTIMQICNWGYKKIKQGGPLFSYFITFYKQDFQSLPPSPRVHPSIFDIFWILCSWISLWINLKLSTLFLLNTKLQTLNTCFTHFKLFPLTKWKNIDKPKCFLFYRLLTVNHPC